MSAFLQIFIVARLICVNPRVRKRGFAVKALQALEVCTRSQREFFFSRCEWTDAAVKQMGVVVKRSGTMGEWPDAAGK